MRSFNTAAQALLVRASNGERVGWVQLVEMHLSTVLRLTTAGRRQDWGGFTWFPAGLGTIEPLDDQTAEMQGLQFAMPGVDQTQLALVLTEPTEGRIVRVYDAIVDPDTGQVADAVLAWSGTLNVPTLADGATAVVTVTAEHRGVSAVRPKPRRYTASEQKRLYPGDTCFDFDPATDAAPLAWPKASFFRQ